LIFFFVANEMHNVISIFCITAFCNEFDQT